MYPSFSKLSTGADAIGAPFDMLDNDAIGAPFGAPFDTLPDDVLQKILGDETCNTVLGVCSVNHPLYDLCNEAFFKAASGRMGFGSPEGGGEGQPPAPSWREFFAKSCRWLRLAKNLRQFRRQLYGTDVNSEVFYEQMVQRDPDPVGKWAILHVHPRLLYYAPKDRRDYGDLAKIAVAKDGWALVHVPEDRSDYGEIAKIAVAKHGMALVHVPKDRPDYGEIARIAVP